MPFNTQEIVLALIGGVSIGISVTLMLLFMGRVTGISGILYGFLRRVQRDWIWRAMFLLGLLAGGLMLRLFYPASLENTLGYSWVRVAIAGLLVGYGTVLGNGCTSGHGVCGISRFSLRSIFATLTFMVFGMMAVWLGKFWG